MPEAECAVPTAPSVTYTARASRQDDQVVRALIPSCSPPWCAARQPAGRRTARLPARRCSAGPRPAARRSAARHRLLRACRSTCSPPDPCPSHTPADTPAAALPAAALPAAALCASKRPWRRWRAARLCRRPAALRPLAACSAPAAHCASHGGQPLPESRSWHS